MEAQGAETYPVSGVCGETWQENPSPLLLYWDLESCQPQTVVNITDFLTSDRLSESVFTASD